jgi:hypothetical protein
MAGNVMDTGYCYATADAVRAYSPVLGICIPEAATTGQVLSVIVKFMTEHPELRDKNIQLIAAEATHRAWPCSR